MTSHNYPDLGVEFGVFCLGLQVQLQTFLEARTMCSKKNTCCNPPGGGYAYSQLLV